MEQYTTLKGQRTEYYVKRVINKMYDLRFALDKSDTDPNLKEDFREILRELDDVYHSHHIKIAFDATDGRTPAQKREWLRITQGDRVRVYSDKGIVIKGETHKIFTALVKDTFADGFVHVVPESASACYYTEHLSVHRKQCRRLKSKPKVDKIETKNVIEKAVPVTRSRLAKAWDDVDTVLGQWQTHDESPVFREICKKIGLGGK